MKKGIRLITTLLSLCGTICFTSAYAVSPSTLANGFDEKPWHFFLTIGIGALTTSHVGTAENFSINNPDTDEFYTYSPYHSAQTSVLFSGVSGIEWHFRPNWAFQAGINYNLATPFSATGTFIQGIDASSANTYNYHYTVTTKQLLFESKLLYTIKKHYHPYLLGGIGAAFNKAYHYYTNVSPLLTLTRTYADHSTLAFSYALGIGMDTDITSNLRLGIGYRFTDLGKAALGNATISNANVNGTLSQSHLYANEALVQFTYVI